MRLITNGFENIDDRIKNAEILDTNLKWKDFCIEINKIIIGNSIRTSSAEDKRLGAYFVNITDLELDENTKQFIKSKDFEKDKNRQDYKDAISKIRKFPEKVLKYLWDDAFKYNRELIFEEYEKRSLEDVIKFFIESKGEYRFSMIFKQSILELLYKK